MWSALTRDHDLSPRPVCSRRCLRPLLQRQPQAKTQSTQRSCQCGANCSGPSRSGNPRRGHEAGGKNEFGSRLPNGYLWQLGALGVAFRNSQWIPAKAKTHCLAQKRKKRSLSGLSLELFRSLPGASPVFALSLPSLLPAFPAFVHLQGLVRLFRLSNRSPPCRRSLPSLRRRGPPIDNLVGTSDDHILAKLMRYLRDERRETSEYRKLCYRLPMDKGLATATKKQKTTASRKPDKNIHKPSVPPSNVNSEDSGKKLLFLGKKRTAYPALADWERSNPSNIVLGKIIVPSPPGF